MEEFIFDSENKEEVKKIYNHIKRIIDKINKQSFKNFRLELEDVDSTGWDGYVYLEPVFLIDDIFITIDCWEVGAFLKKNYRDIISVNLYGEGDYILAEFEDTMNLELFRNTIDLSNKDFELWFKLNY